MMKYGIELGAVGAHRHPRVFAELVQLAETVPNAAHSDMGEGYPLKEPLQRTARWDWAILSPFHKALLCSAVPHARQITEARFFQEKYQPGPMYIRMLLADMTEQAVVLWFGRDIPGQRRNHLLKGI